MLTRHPGDVRWVAPFGRAHEVGRRPRPVSRRPYPRVLDECVLWLDAGDLSSSAQTWPNRGWGGAALDATLGSTTGADTNDPLWLPGAEVGAYVYSEISATGKTGLEVADSATFTPSTSLSYRQAVALTDWTPSAVNRTAGQAVVTANQRSHEFGVDTTGKLRLYLSTDGATALIFLSTVAPTVTDGDLLAIRADWTASPAEVKFYTKATTGVTAYTDCVSDSGWTQLGTTVTASVPSTALYDSTDPFYIGQSGNGGSTGRHHACVLIVDGTQRIGFNPAADVTDESATSLTLTSGQTATINHAPSGRKTVVVGPGGRPRLLFGTDDYCEIADSDLLDFGASEDFTVGVVHRHWATAGSGAVIAKRTTQSTGTDTGWAVQHSAAAGDRRIRTQVADGTTNTSIDSTGDHAYGALELIGASREGTGIASFVNATIGTPSTEGDSLSNANAVRISRLSGAGTNYTEGEISAVFVARRALTAGELYSIARYYGATL